MVVATDTFTVDDLNSHPRGESGNSSGFTPLTRIIFGLQALSPRNELDFYGGGIAGGFRLFIPP